MNTLDDLRRTLADHTPADVELAARPAAVARRVQSVRRRRAAAGATLAAAVVAGVAVAAVVRPGGDGSSPLPADRPTTAAPTAREQVTFRQEAGGYTLQSSMLADPGAAEFAQSGVQPPNVQFAIHCTSSVQVDDGPRMPWVTIEAGAGWRVLQVSCGTGGAPDDDPAAFLYGPDTEDGPGFTATRTDADGTVHERYFAPGRNVTFTVRLTDQAGRRYTRPISGLEMGVGVYSRP